MTKKQLRLLNILDRYSGHGTIEVEIQFGDYEFDNDSDGIRGMRVCRLVVRRLMKSLVQKGYALIGDYGYEITDAGREYLKHHN